jgi:glycine/D-amino acid oxidase-like deaminating enzyme
LDSAAKRSTIPVAIVGGGPVGLVLALFLDRYGVRTVLFNSEEGQRAHPKGSTQNARTLEHFRRLGISEPVRPDPVLQAFRKQRALPAIHPLNEVLHRILRKSRRNHTARTKWGSTFLHKLGHELPFQLTAGTAAVPLRADLKVAERRGRNGPWGDIDQPIRSPHRLRQEGLAAPLVRAP